MAMSNSAVDFRRGVKSNLPSEITDGMISIDTVTGQVFTDIEDGPVSKRIALGGVLYGRSISNGPDKVSEIEGVYEYYDGMTLVMVFSGENNSGNYVYLSVNGLSSVPLYTDTTTQVSCKEIVVGVPYTLVFRRFNESPESRFMVVSGGTGSRPKWKRLAD